MTVKEIEKDLKQFVQGFPKERIPHQSNEEVRMRHKHEQVMKNLLNGQKVDIDLAEFRESDYPD